MKKVYTVLQSMNNGKIRVYEWYIVKETPKTVIYSSLEDGRGLQCQKNKSMFNTVHLNSKREYTGLWQDAYVFVFAESKEEAIQKASVYFKEWLNNLQNGLSLSVEKVEKVEKEDEEKNLEETER